MLFFILLKQEILSFKRISRNFAQNILFFIISCAIFFLISQNPSIQALFGIFTVIIFCLVFTLIFANANFLSEDFHDGTIEQMIISCHNFEIFIAAKIVANWLFYALPIIIFIYLSLILSPQSIQEKSQIAPENLVILLVLASFAINAICAFGSCCGLVNKGSMISAILILPLIIPILLIFSAGIFDPEFFAKSVSILFYLFVFFAIISVFAASKIIKILSE